MRFHQKRLEPKAADFFIERHNPNIQVGKFEETASATRVLNNFGITVITT